MFKTHLTTLLMTISVVLLPGRNSSRASRADTSISPSEEVEVVALESRPAGEDGGWEIELHFANEIEMPGTFDVESTGLLDLRKVSVDGEAQKSHYVSLSIPYAKSPLIAVRILWTDSTEIVHGTYLLFIQAQGALRQISEQDAVGQLDVLEPSTLGPPHPDELSTLSPLDNPTLSAEDREYARQSSLAAETEAVSGALTSSEAGIPASANHRAADNEVGCSMGTASTPILAYLIFLCASVLRRRPRSSGLLFGLIAFAASGASSAHARTVYGYVVFWDSRGIGSNEVGSRLPWCDTNQTNCVAGSANCCFRGLDGITVSVKQFGGPDLASAVANSSGFYAVTFQGNDTLSYYFTVSYSRPSGSGYAGALQELTQLSPPIVYTQTTKVDLPQNTPNYWLADIRVNSGGDTTSISGNRATIWQSVSETQRAISSEGDTRYRHLYGMPQTGPDDVVQVDPTGASGNGSDCPTSLISASSTYARQLFPAFYMATIYRGRVVGCSSTAYSNGVVLEKGPAFPPTPRNAALLTSNPYTGEGIALGVGLDYAVGWLLRRWRPADTTAVTIENAALCLNQNSPQNQKGNDCAFGINNGRGLWEWLDTPTAGIGFGVDNTDLTLKQIMDGLVQLQNTPGTLDGQASEASFAPTSTPCITNESCNAYDACAYQPPSGSTFFCASGDPNGSNIEDLASAINALGTPGRGNLLTSLTSTECVSLVGPDDTFTFDGGYVDN